QKAQSRTQKSERSFCAFCVQVNYHYPFLDFPIPARSPLTIDRRVRLLPRRDPARNESQACAADSTKARVACARMAPHVSELPVPPRALSHHRRSSHKHVRLVCLKKDERP